MGKRLSKMTWDDLTYFGKGLIVGLVSWTILVTVILAQQFYLAMNIYRMNPSVFYVFNNEGFSYIQIFLIGLFLIVVLGAIGWVYGRIVGE